MVDDTLCRRTTLTVVRAADAPTFDVHGATITGAAAPSRGSTQTCLWRVDLAPGSHVPGHILDREEIFHALGGTLVATVDGERQIVNVGDTLIVGPGKILQIEVPAAARFEAVVVMPVGAQARFADGGEPFAPPWTV
jgi:quercetin dioxygenase-like cupin family protein